MMEEIKNLILYENIYETLEVYKIGGGNVSIVDDFCLLYKLTYDSLNGLTYKEILLILITSNLYYNEPIFSKENYEKSLKLYKEYISKKESNHDEGITNKMVYKKLDNEDKKIVEDYYKLFYGNFETGIKIDYEIIDYIKMLNNYLEKAKLVLGDNLLKKISNPKLFALGIYSKEDYNIMLEFNENINKKYNFTEKFDFNTENLYQKFNVPYFHDMGYDIIVKNKSVEFFDDCHAKMTFINATMLNYDKLKKYFDTWKEGYVEYLFKYKDGTYLGIYDFLKLPEPVIIKFDDLNVEYL